MGLCASQPSPHQAVDQFDDLDDIHASSAKEPWEQDQVSATPSNRYRATSTAPSRTASSRSGTSSCSSQDTVEIPVSSESSDSSAMYGRERMKVYQAMVEAERHCYWDLHTIVNVFFTPMQQQDILSEDVVRSIFSDCKVLLGVSKALWTRLEEALNARCSETVSQAFLEMRPALKMWVAAVVCSCGTSLVRTLLSSSPLPSISRPITTSAASNTLLPKHDNLAWRVDQFVWTCALLPPSSFLLSHFSSWRSPQILQPSLLLWVWPWTGHALARVVVLWCCVVPIW